MHGVNFAPVHAKPRVDRICDSTSMKSAKVTFPSNPIKRAREVTPLRQVKKQCTLDTFGDWAVNSRDHLGHMNASMESHLSRHGWNYLLNLLKCELEELEGAIAKDLGRAHSRITELEKRLFSREATPASTVASTAQAQHEQDLVDYAERIDINELEVFLDKFHREDSPIRVQAYPDNEYDSSFSFV